MTETPLYTALLSHQSLHRASFHTPGHKSNPAALPPNLLSLDYTELPDTDSLFEAEGPILRAEEAAAALFGTKRTLLSAGGCTLCIQAMLRLAAPCGGSVLCSRVVHRSAVNTMALLGLTPVWAMPEDLCAAVERHPEVKAVYLTSPNYYGELADIPALAAACNQHGIPLLVDNAHGAHLFFTDPVLHPIALGASMTACSAHKTLNVLTGGAWLHIADERFADEAKGAMSLFGSTSPSYPIMASLDLCRAWLEEHGKAAFLQLQARVRNLKAVLRSTGLRVLGMGPDDSPLRWDPTRITVDTASIGLTGTEAAERLRQAGCEPEYADSRCVVCIATPFNTEEDFARLEAGFCEMLRHAGAPLPAGNTIAQLPPLPPVRASLREAVLAPAEAVPLASSAGRIAAEPACPCPPGVPVVMPGEEITREAVEFLRSYGFSSIKVLK